MKKRIFRLFSLLVALVLLVGISGGISVAPIAVTAEPATTNLPISRLNVDRYAYTNASIVQRPIKGVVLDFHDINQYMEGVPSTPELAQQCADNSILYIIPYDNPWSFMNDKTVRYVDELMEAVFARFNLTSETPIVTCGTGMGGLSSFIYTVYGKYKPVACAADSPITDLPYHYTEQIDMRRTLYQTFMHYEQEDLYDAFRTASPYHQVENLPDIPYLIVHGGKDKRVDKEKHSDVFVPELKKNHTDVTYIEVADMAHGDLQGDAKTQYYDFILTHAS